MFIRKDRFKGNLFSVAYFNRDFSSVEILAEGPKDDLTFEVFLK